MQFRKDNAPIESWNEQNLSLKIKKSSKFTADIFQKKFVVIAILAVLLFSIAYFSTNFISDETINSTPIDYPTNSETQMVLPKETNSIQQTSTLIPETNIVSPISSAKLLLPLINTAHATVRDTTSTSATSSEWIVPTVSAVVKGITYWNCSNCSTIIYFTENAANKIGKLTPGTGQFVEWPVFTAGSGPTDIVADLTLLTPANQVLYFTENSSDKIGKLETQTGTMTEWPLAAGKGLGSMVKDSTGNVYFAENTVNKIGKLVPSTNTFTEWDVPTASAGLGDMVIDATGKIYFIETTANKIGRLIPGSGQFTEWTIPTLSSGLTEIAVDSLNNIYFTENVGNKIGKLNPSTNTFTEWTVPTSSSGPSGIAIHPTTPTTIIFTENTANKFGRLVTTTNPAVITEWNIPNPSSGSCCLIADGFGIDWFFIEQNTNSIGRFT